jgi:hypothetical protein
VARGNECIVTSNPKGVFREGFISGTPKPGIVVEHKVGTALRGGRFTYEPAGTTANSGANQGMAADGNRLPICILLPDHLQGKTMNDAYADGDRCFLYYPVAGEELNMIIENQSGTADDFVAGDKLIVDDGTGKLLISAGTPEAEPFICQETATDLTADNLTWVMFTGC